MGTKLMTPGRVRQVLAQAFEVWLKGKCLYSNIADLLNTYEQRFGVSLNLETEEECKATLSFLTTYLPSNGSVGNNQFWKVCCCLLNEVGGKGVSEPERLDALMYGQDKEINENPPH